MGITVRRNIVVSAVNLRKGGTLTVLRDCLRYLSSRPELLVTALVHRRELCDFPGIEYIEIPWSIRSWAHRLWCEYVTMYRISQKLPATDLWLSLHDTTPCVKALRQAVYCHNAFPFMKPLLLDWRMDPKIPLFCRFSGLAYKTNISRNSYLIVQQQWMRKGIEGLTGFPEARIIVAPPRFKGDFSTSLEMAESRTLEMTTFLYPGTPDTHKNFETLCEAARILEKRIGKGRFRVLITINGEENRYASWLHSRYGTCPSIDFHGFMPREDLYAAYGTASCLVFSSRAETWGLPISEFLPTGKPMILADLPYAHETAAGAAKAAFVPAKDAKSLADRMMEVIDGNLESFGPVPKTTIAGPSAMDWQQLFDILLDENPAIR